jgi:hypothetical protein
LMPPELSANNHSLAGRLAVNRRYSAGCLPNLD